MQPKCSEMRLRCGGHGCRRWGRRFRPPAPSHRRRTSVRRLLPRPIMGRARVSRPHPITGGGRVHIPRPLMGRAPVSRLCTRMGRRRDRRPTRRAPRGRSTTPLKWVLARVIALAWPRALGVIDLWSRGSLMPLPPLLGDCLCRSSPPLAGPVPHYEGECERPRRE